MKEIKHATPDPAAEKRFITNAEAEGFTPGDWPTYIRYAGEILSRFTIGPISARYCGLVNVVEVFEEF